MVFSSTIFIFYFLPVFLAAYYLLGSRNGILLTGSVIFYTWGEGEYVLLLGALIVGNFHLAHLMSLAAPTRRTQLLAFGVAGNLVVLGYFKYAGFLLSTITSLAGVDSIRWKVVLPLGISFFTFQLISYLVDVARGAVTPDRNLVRFATYILMFPHLIAGPIVRYADIESELKARQTSVEKVGLGFQYFIVGLCQKLLIANTVAGPADAAFGLAANELTLPTAWLGILCYSLQIYFDFCGYSNMAIGLAFMLGFRFPKNFDYPYAATSMTDFWRRWHISLSSWFRDYVYIPLGGNRGGTWLTIRNLVIVFFLTGLWHGAAWTFIVWGLYHGALLLAERVGLQSALGGSPRPLRHLYTWLAFMIGWIFFRADDMPHAMAYLQAMFVGSWNFHTPLVLWTNPETFAAIGLGILFSQPFLPWLMDRLKQERIGRDVSVMESRLDAYHVHALPSPALILGFALCMAFLAATTLNPFLYFRF
ncbi:MAG TPA: MBOAT family protein [Microvirga sp.]